MTSHDKQQELEQVRAAIVRLTAGHTVLELGCGSGGAGEEMVPGATCVVATHPSDLPNELGGFNAVFIGFGWSRLTRDEQEPFLKVLRARVGKDALLVLLDDAYVEGLSPTIARTDAQGNTFHMGAMPDGKQVEMSKNYPTDSTLRKRLGSAVREIKIQRWEHYWLLSCRLK